jgi:hypothetical protein
MFNRIHQKLGTAGFIISIVALVVALGGGAYAASGGLNGKQKKEVEKIAKKYAGKSGAPGAPGPLGTTGPAGAPGVKGDIGAAGSGTNGTNGEAGMCSEARPDCTLSPDATLTGAWATGGAGFEETNAISNFTISFPVTVSPAPVAIIENQLGPFRLGNELGEELAPFFGPSGGLNELEEKEEAFLEACPGTAAAPEAAPGFLCIYRGKTEGEGVQVKSAAVEPAHEFGALVPMEVPAGGWARGSWAVTAE